MILHRYLDALGDKVHDRLIDAAMPVFELHHLSSCCFAQHLMPQADAEERHFSEQLFYLASRGISPDDAERLFITASFEEAAINAPDQRTLASVARLAAARGIEIEEAVA